MADEVRPQQGQEEMHLPIDLKTVLIALRHKFWWLVAIAVIACGAGVGAAILFGTQKYESTTVLYYQPISSYISDTFRVYQSVGEGTELSYEQGAGLTKRDETDTSLWNRVNMVKIQPNLEELRNQLGLELRLDQLGASISVDIAQETNLMFITGFSSEPEMAASIANTIRDIFLENTSKIIEQDIQEQISNLEQQYTIAAAELDQARKDFIEFIQENKIKNIDIETEKYTSELISLEMSLQKSRMNRDILAEKVAKVKDAIQTAQQLDEEEQLRKEQQLQSQGMTPDESTNRIQQLQQRIDELRMAFVRDVEFDRLKRALEIAEERFSAGELSIEEYEKQRYEYDLFIASNRDDEQIRSIQEEIERLREMTYLGRGDSVATSDFIKEMRLKLLDNELLLIEAERTYESELERYEILNERYQNLPVISQMYFVLSGQTASLEAETRGLFKVLAQSKIAAEQEQSDFYVISDAVIPQLPLDSNKKLIAVAVTFLVFLVGFVIIMLQILLDTRIKSAGEVKQKLQVPVLGILPHKRNIDALIPNRDKNSDHIEIYRIMARPLRVKYRNPCVTFLMTSSVPGEGKSVVAINLAAVFGRQDEHVLLIDAQVRKNRAHSLLDGLLFDEGSPAPFDVEDMREQDRVGLGEYLSYREDVIDNIIIPTYLPGVDMIMMRGEAVIPDLLQSIRMKELIADLKTRYSIIIMEGPPVGESVDSELLTQYCDATILVTASNGPKPDTIRKVISRLQQTEIPLEGIVLTGVSPSYVS